MAARTGMGLVAGLALLLAVTSAEAQKYGGVARMILATDPGGLSIHEEATTRTLWPMVPVYNNLVQFDVFSPQESLQSVVADLAESWSWSADQRSLTFRLRQGVHWHDGKPLTSGDVKHTFDVVRGLAKERLRLNPRKLWYGNVTDVTTEGDQAVTFRLRRPQPSLLAMLSSGFSPVIPAHVSLRDLRTRAVGTGPFTFTQYVSNKSVNLAKNPDYFVKGRPYLDGLVFPIIPSGPSRTAAMIANQADVNMLMATPKPVYEALKAANVAIEFHEQVAQATYNVIINTRKPPFSNAALRRAVVLAIDRASLIRSVFDGAGVPGGVMMPRPYGVWGLTEEQLRGLPGYGNAEANRDEARRLLAEQGHGPKNPLKVKVSARSGTLYSAPAQWLIGQLNAVGVQGELESIENAVWYGRLARRDYQLGLNATAVGIDDPDANLFENYSCGSYRNYSDYCDPKLDKLFDQQSIEPDLQQRQRIVNEIDIGLSSAGFRPMLMYRVDYYPHWRFVKNFIPHTSSIYNAYRFQELWLDK
ncbi:MAG: ABC transporter substrate-binding protein [Candidatus Lambdaproteobacteria bacterium]|nr:ABC transporter substrate-binding protein [Candidatus Lambdaproteobacteria bacterium]